MRKYVLYLFLIGMFSCKGEKDIPGDVLQPAKMEAVLYDLIKADELINFKALGDSAYQKLARRTILYDTVFAMHGIQKELFKKSLQFYQNQPDLLKPMFESLQKKAEALTYADTVKVKKDTSKAKGDTLKRKIDSVMARRMDSNFKQMLPRPFFPIRRRMKDSLLKK